MQKTCAYYWLWLVVFGVLLPDGLRAEEPEQLIKLRNAYKEAHVAALEPLTKKYFAALAALREKYSKAGNLEAALIVKSEEEGKNETDKSDQPKGLVTLNQKYQEVRDKESAKVTQKYLKALVALQKKLTQAGDLDGALMVKKEHAKYLSGEKKEAKKKRRIGKWTKKTLIGTAWALQNGDTYFFEKAGVLRIRFQAGHETTRDRWLWKPDGTIAVYFPNSQGEFVLGEDGVSAFLNGGPVKLVEEE